jgi:hypothetical protein
MLQSNFIYQLGNSSDGQGRFTRPSDGTRHAGFLDSGFTAIFPGDSQLQAGDVLFDQQLNKSYLLGELHRQYGPSCDEHYVGSLFECNSHASLIRYAASAKKHFGISDYVLETISVNFPVLIRTGALTVEDSQDKFLVSGRSKALIPGKIPVKLSDRLSTPKSDFMVIGVDKNMWDGALQVIDLIPDRR